MNHEEVAKRFAQQRKNSRSGKVEWTGFNVFCQNDILFSYGYHFPLAKYLGDSGSLSFVRNEDKYSNSTSHHQSITAEHCKGPSVSASALHKHIDFTELKLENIHLWRPGMCRLLWRHRNTGVYYDDYIYNSLSLDDDDRSAEILFDNEFKPPRYGEWKPRRKQEHYDYEEGLYVVDQVVVLKIKKKFLLCSQGKVKKLSGCPKNVSQALKMVA